jgi:phosphomannomutase/phosphoglucomutase
MTSHIFREYDIRGVADRDLTSDVAYGIGRGFATLLGSSGGAPLRIAVARDCRVSGPRIVADLVSGLTKAGAHVIDVGEGPTPLLYFAVHHLNADGGIMVTGSHNPGDENGFKMMRGKASFYGEDIQALKRLIESGDYGPEKSGTRESLSVDDAYVAAVTSSTKLADPSMKVVVDAGNGAAGPLALRTLRALGLEPTALYCDMDGSFPNHHPDPTVPKNLAVLIDTVKKEKARIGIAFDGDGDRLGVVDSSGEIIWGDRLLALFARDVLAKTPGAAVIGEVKCSQALFDDVAKHGGRPIMWKTGHSLIKTKMKAEKALLAGEMSGHFFFADRYFGFDDGIYAATRILEIVSREGKTLAELLADLPQSFSTPELRVDCPDGLKADVVAAVREHFASRYETSAIDGVRIKYDDGAWALVRASNTGPIIVLRFEAPTEARLAQIRDEVETFLEATRASKGAGPSRAHG